MIPFGDPSASYQAHKSEIDQAIKRVLDSGRYILGTEVDMFENEFASFHGNDFHAVGVANGTDAIALCLSGLGLGTGDEVITPSHTAVATVAGIEQAGCKPIFADIDPNTRCISPDSIKENLGDNTQAIMPVHIYGQPAEMQRILDIANVHNLAVIEDCSQAHGAEIDGQKVGTFADISAYSCYPTKNLGGTGDGGVILCRSKEFAEKIKSLRQYGWNAERESIMSGFNSRLDELQAAILRVKLQHLADDNAKRRAIALSYNEAFKDLPITSPVLAKTELHAMHLYVIECDQRNELMEYLRNNQIGASLHYPLAVHQHNAYAHRILGGYNLPITDLFYQKNLTLPMYPELSNDALEHVISMVKKWFREKN
ncbi:MAG: erythromycin biosynthesis sensory transduction protein eryC1 [Opitutae bacterium]|nr:erythromycin biosynthesis sensory transduction protein eryC1 [Opitutae bacterium]|tara:strand:- start:1126 stop:2235 length:1110 start_codon:yes stop_codon:yes gene_type:complete